MRDLLITNIKNFVKRPIYRYLVTYHWKEISFSSSILNQLRNSVEQSNATTSKNISNEEEKQVVQIIKERTVKYNKNNVTRTNEYYRVFQTNRELHWALLAHLVSRNAGWSMTDLKGEYLPHLLSAQQRKAFFHFFERSNALIFQDAYPQLLLYEESKKRGKSLFHLLPEFYVSIFMKPFWEQFFENGEEQLLTVALIINEQHYIEKRIVQNPLFQHIVFDTIEFKLQAMLQFSLVVFPYHLTKKIPCIQKKNRLAGLTLNDFTNISERITLGKRLYAILFGIKEVSRSSIAFASNTPHTGSRQDCWPDLFSAKKLGGDTHKLEGSPFLKQPHHAYSPKLLDVWPEVRLERVEREDWYPAQSNSVWNYFCSFETPTNYDRTKQFYANIHKLQLATAWKEDFF